MRFDVGCDLDEFRRYYGNSDIYEYLKSVGLTRAQSGMKAMLKNTEKVTPETRKTEKH